VGKQLFKAHSLLWIKHQHFLDEVFCSQTDIFIKLYEFLVRLLYLFFLELMFVEEGIPSCQHFIGDNSEAPNITFFIVVLSKKYFGGHSERSADPGGEILFLLKFGKPEISQFDFEILGN
jgi:hypothetical protein